MSERRAKRLWSAITAILVCATTTLTVDIVTASRANAAACAPVEMVAFRGSGENGANYEGGQGSTLAPLIAEAKARPLKDGYSSASVPVYGVPYPAVDMDQWVSFDLFNSIQYGALLGAGYIRTRHAACPDTRYLLLGFSQGVAVARQVAQHIGSDVIGGVFGLGDPYQKPNADGVEGPGAGGNGLLRWLAGTSEVDEFYDLPTPKFTYCHAADGICNPGTIESFTFYDHLNYGDDLIERIVLAAQINIMLRNSASAGPPTGGVGGGGTGHETLARSVTDLQSSANPSVYGQPIAFSVTVAGGSGRPSGAVTFFAGQRSLGSRTLQDGAASLTTTLPVGTYKITAYYGGDQTYSPSSESVDQVVNKAATSTGLTSSPSPSVYCEMVTLASHVGVIPPGGGNPSGAVVYRDGPNVLGSSALGPQGDSALTTQFFRVGTHPLTANYEGDSNFLASTSAVVSHLVNRAPTVTTITTTPATQNLFGRTSSFTATVTAPPPGCGSPTGTVRFSVDGVEVQSASLDSLSSATLTTAALVPGDHIISVYYDGDENFLPSSGRTTYHITCSRLFTGSIKGSVAASGESTCLLNATLTGAVHVPASVRFAAVNSTIGGAVVANTSAGSNMIAVCGSRLGGEINIEHNRELVMIGDPAAACSPNYVNGSIIIRQNTNGVEVIGNMYGGTLLANHNSGPGPFGQLTMIGDNHRR